MPASGDNKPKLQKFINKAVAATNDTKLGFMLSVIATIGLFLSVVILVLAGIRIIEDKPIDYGFAWLTLGVFVTSIAFLTRKIQNVPDNH